jgi:hypothetical protein
VCHDILNNAKFYQYLFQIDQAIAVEVQAGGCVHCGGVLHSACYPRKPRGVRTALDASYRTRLSFCCARDGCRRRNTPPSIRFLGRKVYLGIIVILVTALEHGLAGSSRDWLVEHLDLWPQTMGRWRQWWRGSFVASRCWREARGRFLPPVNIDGLPDALLGRLRGRDLTHHLCLLLRLVAPITTTSWAGFLRVAIDPQKM